MSVFASIWKKINDPWGITEKKRLEQEAKAHPAPVQPTPRAAPAAPTAAPAPKPAPAAPPVAAPVDIEQVLTELAAKHPGGGGNWKVSIVDLLRLLDLDYSLAARKELANELNVHAGEPGTAEQNIALHKAVMRQLQANGGKVPPSMLD